jgi:hypothetical protein
MVMGADYAICCDAWEAGYQDAFTLKIFFGDSSGEGSFWKLFFIVDEVSIDSTYAFPSGNWNWSDGSWDGPPLILFCVDVSNGNELSSSEDESTGTITIHSLDCGPPVHVDFSIEARVDSEMGGPYVDVSGTFSATVHSNPHGCDFSL